jgi:hypothetical protein
MSMFLHLGIIDFGIIIRYFVAVLVAGYFLKGKMKTSADFLLSGRSFFHWVRGIAFMSANLGALEGWGCRKWRQVWHADQPLVRDRSHSRRWFSSDCLWALSQHQGVHRVCFERKHRA